MSKPIGVITPISQQEIRFEKLAEHSCSPGVISDLAWAEEEAQQFAIAICQSMNLGVEAAFRAADQAPVY